MKQTGHKDVSTALEETRETLVGEFEGMTESYLCALPDFREAGIGVIEMIGAFALSAHKSDVPAVMAKYRMSYDRFYDCVSRLQDVVTQAESDLLQARNENTELTNLLARERELAATNDQKTLVAFDRRDERIAELERLIAQTPRPEARLAALVQRITTTEIDNLMEIATEIKILADRICADAETGLEIIGRETFGLEKRTTAISDRSGSLLAQNAVIRAEELDTIREIITELDHILKGYEEIRSMTMMLHEELDDVRSQFAAWDVRWKTLRMQLTAAGELVPLLLGDERTLASFAGVHEDTIAAKRSICGERAIAIQQAIQVTADVVSRRTISLHTSDNHTRARLLQLSELRSRLDLPWFATLTPDLQKLCRYAVFSFKTGRDDNRQLRRIIDTVRRTNVWTDASALENNILIILATPFFLQRGEKTFRVFSLSELGRWWHTQRAQEFPDLANELHAYRIASDEDQRLQKEIEYNEAQMRAQERAQQKEERDKKRREIDRQREERDRARESERRNPILVRNQLKGPIEISILVAIRLVPSVPAARDAIGWATLLFCAQMVDIIPTANAYKLSQALKRVFLVDPPLFERGSQGRLVLSELGREVVELAFIPPPDTQERLESLLARDSRAWDEPDRKFKNEIRLAIHTVISKLEDGTLP